MCWSGSSGSICLPMNSCFFFFFSPLGQTSARITARQVCPVSFVDGCWLFPGALLLAYITARAGFSFMYSQVMLQLIGCADIKVAETRCRRCSIKIRLADIVTSSVHSLPTRLVPSLSPSLYPPIHPFFYHPSRNTHSGAASLISWERDWSWLAAYSQPSISCRMTSSQNYISTSNVNIIKIYGDKFVPACLIMAAAAPKISILSKQVSRSSSDWNGVFDGVYRNPRHCSSPRLCNQDAVSSTPLHPISSHFLYWLGDLMKGCDASERKPQTFESFSLTLTLAGTQGCHRESWSGLIALVIALPR